MILLYIRLYRLFKGIYPPYSGGCLLFHFELKSIFGGVGYYNSDHVITKIGGKYYDINGLVENIEGFITTANFGADYFIGAFSDFVEPRLIIKYL